MDTASDYRILVAEKASSLLIKWIENAGFYGKWNKKLAIKSAREIPPEIQKIKYSYMSEEEIEKSLYMEKIRKNCLNILEALGGQEWWKKIVDKNSEETAAKIRFALNILYNLPSRLKLPSSLPAYAVDIRCGKVVSVRKHPNADKLLVCNVNIGRKITVVTNDLSVKDEDRVAVALLPPANIRGIVSEGMFIGCGEGVEKNVDGEIGNFPTNLQEECLKEVSARVIEFLKM